MTATIPDKANASPTKDFFVSMLTRDISLPDAILDLVDNSLDGVLRVFGEDADYKKRWAKIEFDQEHFSITDNCGGLARKIAIEYAFKMGRDSGDDRDGDVETIGMYGIGMKRAMFKMGQDCRVVTHFGKKDHYQVRMDRKWLESRLWNKLPLEPVLGQERLGEAGTKVMVRDLRPGIVQTFAEPSFRKELMDGLSEHFAKFIERGFRITVNGMAITPARIEVLYDPAASGIKPYYVTCKVGATEVRVAMGLNPRAQIADDRDEAGSTRAIPGWSVFCNDRAVLVGDTTRLTGWGERPVPRYHDQFDILTGIVEFRAKDARDLPVTTTKRDLDASAEAWLVAKGYMRDATRKLVTHTNAWKNERKAHRALFPATAGVQMEQIRAAFEGGGDSELLRKRPGSDHFAFNPERLLPKPETSEPGNRKITFSRPKKEVERLAEELLDDQDASPSEVGAECFDYAYRELVGR